MPSYVCMSMAGLNPMWVSLRPEDYKDVQPSNPVFIGVSSHPAIMDLYILHFFALLLTCYTVGCADVITSHSQLGFTAGKRL